MCRIFQKGGKDSKIEGGWQSLNKNSDMVCAQLCRRCRWNDRLLFWTSGDSPPWVLPFSAFFLGSCAELGPDAPHQRKFLCKLLSCHHHQKVQALGDEISAAETSKLT